MSPSSSRGRKRSGIFIGRRVYRMGGLGVDSPLVDGARHDGAFHTRGGALPTFHPAPGGGVGGVRPGTPVGPPWGGPAGAPDAVLTAEPRPQEKARSKHRLRHRQNAAAAVVASSIALASSGSETWGP